MAYGSKGQAIPPEKNGTLQKSWQLGVSETVKY